MKHKGTELIYAGVVLGAWLLGLAGCTTVGPDYKPHQMPAPTNWSSALGAGLSGAVADTNLLERWWTEFNDRQGGALSNGWGQPVRQSNDGQQGDRQRIDQRLL